LVEGGVCGRSAAIIPPNVLQIAARMVWSIRGEERPSYLWLCLSLSILWCRPCLDSFCSRDSFRHAFTKEFFGQVFGRKRCDSTTLSCGYSWSPYQGGKRRVTLTWTDVHKPPSCSFPPKAFATPMSCLEDMVFSSRDHVGCWRTTTRNGCLKCLSRKCSFTFNRSWHILVVTLSIDSHLFILEPTNLDTWNWQEPRRQGTSRMLICTSCIRALSISWKTPRARSLTRVGGQTRINDASSRTRSETPIHTPLRYIGLIRTVI
jgi:hypothetical protein